MNDKINALKEIVSFRNQLFSIDRDYIEGVPYIDDLYEYNQSIYRKVSSSSLSNLKEIVLKKGYLFPKEIKDKMNLLIFDLTKIYDIQKREFSVQKLEMPKEAPEILDNLSEKLNMIVDDIRKDLHIDNSFIHDFIEKYKKFEI